jgi:WD40 repeat protein
MHLRHQFSTLLACFLFAGSPGCGAATWPNAQPSGEPEADLLPTAVLRQPDLRIGSLRFRHQLAGHALAFARDGKSVFSGGTDGTVREWDAATGECRRTLGGDRGMVLAIALALDGRTLASGQEDGSVRLWNLTTNKELWRTRAHNTAITSLAFAKEGRNLVSAGYDGVARVLDSATGREVRRLWSYEGGAVMAAVSADGKFVATAGLDHAVRVWKASDWSEVKCMFQVGIDAMCFSPDGRLVVAAGGSEQITLLDIEAGKECPQSPENRDVIYAVAFSPDGKEFVTAGYNRAVVWDTATGKSVRELEGLCERAKAVVYSGDGTLLAIGGDDGVVRLFDWPSGRPLGRPEGHQACVTNLAVTPDGKTLASGGWDGTVRLWEIPSGKPLRTLTWELGQEFWRSTEGVSSISICGQGRRLASSTCDGPVRIWDLLSGNQMVTISRKLGTGAVILTQDGNEVLIGGLDATLGYWDTKTGKSLRIFEDVGPIRHLALSPDGETLACPGSAIPLTVELRSTRSGALISELAIPADKPVTTLTNALFSFSPDGKLLIVARPNLNGEASHPLCLFDVGTGNHVRSFGHRAGITALAYSPDGSTVAAACEGGAIGLWDVSTGERRDYFGTGQWVVRSLVFSRDGNWLFSGGEDGTICGWRLRIRMLS